MSKTNGSIPDAVQQATQSLGMPRMHNAATFNLSNKVVIKRLCLPLPNLVDGEGKNAKVISTRFAYMYPDVPDTFFISSSRLFGPERGIQVFFLDFWHETGLTGFESESEEEDRDKRLLLEGLEDGQLFVELSTKYTLKSLLGMGYISERCLLATLEQEESGQSSLYTISSAAIESNASLETMQQLQIVDSVARLGQRPLKAVSDITDTKAITQEALDRPNPEKPSNLADGNIVPGIPVTQESEFSVELGNGAIETVATVLEDTAETETPQNSLMQQAFSKAKQKTK